MNLFLDRQTDRQTHGSCYTGITILVMDFSEHVPEYLSELKLDIEECMLKASHFVKIKLNYT